MYRLPFAGCPKQATQVSYTEAIALRVTVAFSASKALHPTGHHLLKGTKLILRCKVNAGSRIQWEKWASFERLVQNKSFDFQHGGGRQNLRLLQIKILLAVAQW